MLDWITSKIGMIFAAGVIAAAMLGFFIWQQENFYNIERQNMANLVAEQIDLASSSDGAHRMLITFDPDKKDIGVFVEPIISGESYTINITSDLVVVRQKDGGQFVAALLRSVHCTRPTWAKDQDMLNYTQLQAMDRGNRSLEINSGEDFYIESVILMVSRHNEAFGTEYHTFIYPA